MKNKHLNIISFNIPYPANYGGVIDVFYRIKALAEKGIKIHLHCYKYGREEAGVLSDLCEEVVYYERSLSVLKQFSTLPFIVKTRDSNTLFDNLLKNDYPILFEGLHSCYCLSDERLKNRIKIVRSHNIEHDYYRGLAQGTKSILKKVYFSLESQKLKRFERTLNNADHVLAISKADFEYLEQRYGNTVLMLPNHPSEEVRSKTGKGDYILYHGDLSVHENINAALFLLNDIAPKVGAEFVIAGKNPSPLILEKAEACYNVKVMANPSFSEMEVLVTNAHINYLPTFQATGFKLKLLNALFNGRFCVGTPQLVEGTGVEACCETGVEAQDQIDILKRVLKQDFNNREITKRKELLENYSNSSVISVLIDII